MKNDSLDHQSSARDVFSYLLLILMLISSVVSFMTLLWQYINIGLPDALDYYSISYDLARTAVATLLIVWPVFLGISWLVLKDLSKEPRKQQLWVRRWLLYFAVFVAALATIIDLVTLVNTFLNGEITTRFILKVLAILVVAVSVLAYELWELRRDVTQPTQLPRLAAVISSLAVVIGIVAMFFVAGSPQTQRAIRLDGQRVQQLADIQYQLIDFWQRKQMLPESLDELKNELSGYVPAVDLVTGVAYSYKKTGENTFTLCASFDYKSLDLARGQKLPPYQSVFDQFSHEAGDVCFDRTIDPDTYPPYKGEFPVPPRF